MEVGVKYNAAFYERRAEYFGVSVDNYFDSLPDIGMQAMEIGQSGLTILSPANNSITRRSLQPSDLFQGSFSQRNETSDEVQFDTEGTYAVPESVEEYCRHRNISSFSLLRIGTALLDFAQESNARPGIALDVYKDRDRKPLKKGTLDSTLSFKISPINFITMQRKPANVFTKTKRKLLTK
jgi:hypothetical protein